MVLIRWFSGLGSAGFPRHDSVRVSPDAEGHLLVELLQVRVNRAQVNYSKQAQYAEETVAEVHRLVTPKDQPEDQRLDEDEEGANVARQCVILEVYPHVLDALGVPFELAEFDDI